MDVKKAIKNNRSKTDFVNEFLYSKIIEKNILLFYKLKIHPNIITFLAFLFQLTAIGMMYLFLIYDSGNIYFKMLYVFLIQYAYIMDYTDGCIARLTNKQTKFGAWFDATTDRIGEILILFFYNVFFFQLTNNLNFLFFNNFVIIIFIIDQYSYIFKKNLSNGNESVKKNQSKFKFFKGITSTMLMLLLLPLFNNMLISLIVYSLFLFLSVASIIKRGLMLFLVKV